MTFGVKDIEPTRARIKAIIDNYGVPFFQGKSVLDLGAGHGEIGAALARLGATVTCVDARQENLDIINVKHPHLKTIKTDLDCEWQLGHDYDIVLSIGLICHLKNYEQHLNHIYRVGSHIVLETEVADTEDRLFRMAVFEERKVNDLSFNGEGSVLSATNIEHQLRSFGAQFKRVDESRINAGPYRYDWKCEQSGQRKPGNRRIWFIRHDKLLDAVMGSNKAMRSIHSHLPAPTYPDPNVPRQPPAPPPPLPNLIVKADMFAQPPRHIEVSLPEQGNARVAILISGHLRVFEKTYKRLQKSVIGGIRNCDVFIHTWETLGARKSRGREHDNPINNEKTTNKLNEIMNAYNPKGLVIEKYEAQKQIRDHCAATTITSQEKKGFYGDDIFDYSAMLFSWQKVWRMMEDYERTNGIAYDVVFKYRPDILFPDPLNVLNNKIVPRTIYIPDTARYLANGMNDQLAFGSRDGMGVYCNLYDRQIEYLNKRVIKPMAPETLLKHHLQCNGITTRMLPIKYYILRASGQLVVPKFDGVNILPNQNQVLHLL